MSVFPGFGGWIQQPLKAESKRPKNVKSNSVSKKNTNNIQEPWYWDPNEDPKVKAKAMKSGDIRSMPVHVVDPKYYDLAEVKRQAIVWSNENNKKHPWPDDPAKVKVKTENGVSHMNIKFTLGFVPQGTYEMLTNPRNLLFFRSFDTRFGQRLDNKSTKVLKKNGPRQITKVEKTLRLKLFSWSGSIPIHLIIDENHQNLTAKYKKEKMICMKVFKGSWKIEPLYIDSKRFCNQSEPRNPEEYKRCSNGQGRIASKVTMEQIFQPSSLLNFPPFSWIIRWIIIKTTKILIEDLRQFVIQMDKD